VQARTRLRAETPDYTKRFDKSRHSGVQARDTLFEVKKEDRNGRI
jgi:hypothetical protein